MGIIELWLGPAGSGKTGEALTVMNAELRRNWQAVRYIVPTVGHKRSIEQLFLSTFSNPGLFGDPVNIFFTFAQEVGRRGGVTGHCFSELQKNLLLKELVRNTPLDYFLCAARFPGFVQALGDSFDELKVQMIQPEELLKAAQVAEERGSVEFAKKIFELGTLYSRYQQKLIDENLYDNEGMMWLAAECLRTNAELFGGELKCLILDGFARLTPIQINFLRALAPRAERTILLFDYEESRTATFNPVKSSLDKIFTLEENDGINVIERYFSKKISLNNALNSLRIELFRDRKVNLDLSPDDNSVKLFCGATPAHEAELVAREVRSLLRAGKLPDGTPLTPADIAILGRNGDRLRERFTQTFQRYGLTIRRDTKLLAHTSIGRGLLAAFRLVRENWKREDVLTLLKSGFLEIDPAAAFSIDIIARTNYLHDRRRTWFDRWPDDKTRDVLAKALTPLAIFDEFFHRRIIQKNELFDAIETLLQSFMHRALPDVPPLPDEDADAAHRFVALKAAFEHCETILNDLKQMSFSQGLKNIEALEVFTTALMREKVPEPAATSEGIPVLSVHTTGGEKFKVVFLCDLLQGSFPRHIRESAFLMDHEREETLRDLQLLIESRKSLENDEQFWFLHALSSATKMVILSSAQNDLDGRPLEQSSFIDEVKSILPALSQKISATSFRDVVPPIEKAESREEFYAGLANQLHGERDAERKISLAAAYDASVKGQDGDRLLTRAFQRAQPRKASVTGPEVIANFLPSLHLFSASELQEYIDCPFVWFGGHCLRVRPVVEEFSPLDRGQIIHAVLERLFRGRQHHPGEPVHLGDFTFEELWPEVEKDLLAKLSDEQRFVNRAEFLKDIELESLRRMLERFLRNEINRAKTYGVHPAYFEKRFGDSAENVLMLGEGTLRLRGTIDRIDIVDHCPSKAIVIDYKSSASMQLKDLKDGKVLQVPIYLLAVQRLFGLEPLGAEFIGLKQGDSKGIYLEGIKVIYDRSKGIKELEPDEWNAFLEECEQRLCEAAEAMGRGEIDLTPTTKRCPDSCEYFALCRGDRYSLAGMVHNTAAVDPPADSQV